MTYTQKFACLATLTVSLISCGDDAGDKLIEDYVTTSGVRLFTDCGKIETGLCSAWKVTTEQQKTIDCLLDAFIKGAPVKGVVTTQSKEGEPVKTSYFLEQKKVVVFIDTTGQADGIVTRQDCEELKAADARECGGLKFQSCSAVSE